MATDYNSKYSGEQVEALLDQVASGNAGGGGGGITVETDPVFSASPAASITDAKKAEWDNKVDKVSGKQLSTEDFTTALKTKLEGLSNYDDTELSNALSTLRGDFDKLVSGDTTTAIKTFNEIVAFLEGIEDSQDLEGIIASIEQQIAGKQDTIKDLATIREGASKGATAVQPSDIPEETYLADFTMFSLRQGMNNGGQVNCDMNSLIEAMAANKTILVREDEESDGYKGVCVLNGYAEDLLYFSIVDHTGDILYCEGTDYTNTSSYIDGRTLYVRRWDDKQDALVSGENIKTINGESIVGEGDITIEQGPKGEKGDKGDKGDTGANGTNGVSVSSIKQTTTSSADGGTNVVTVTLSNGTTSTFSVKNGSKGSNGTNGTNGKDGADGEDGATFTPSVDSAGNLSWSNNKGLANPPTVNIKGPKGDKGDAGEGVATEEYVNNAIANAITNVINASY